MSIFYALLSCILCVSTTPCSGAQGSFIMESINFPDEMIIGERNYFTITGSYPKTITSGVIVGKVYKGPFKLITKTQNLCEKANCPLTGKQEIKTYIRIPNVPAMNLKLIVDFSDQDGERIGCFQVPLKLVSARSSLGKLRKWYSAGGKQ